MLSSSYEMQLDSVPNGSNHGADDSEAILNDLEANAKEPNGLYKMTYY